MHIKINLGGKYTFVSFDIPVPVVGWLWDDIHRKYFLEKEIQAQIKKEEMIGKIKKEQKEELEKLKEAGRIFQQAINRANGLEKNGEVKR